MKKRVLRRFDALRRIAIRRLISILSLIIFIITISGLPTVVSAQAPKQACSTSSPSTGGYSITICMTNPVDGSTLTGLVGVTVSISTTGSFPGIQRVVYSINNGYLLTAFQSPYSFTLPTNKWADSNYTLGASALVRDGFTSSAATIRVSFKNGNKKPPVNTNKFQPTSGTTPVPGNPFIVAAGGDGASGEINSSRATDLLGSINPNLFLYLGDVYEKGSPAEFTNWYGSSTEYFGKFRSITDPAIGNHEYSYDSSASGYFDYWDNIPNYYSYDAGGWHFIALNSTTQFNQTSPGTPQYTWLAQDLSANATKCTIVYFHHPVFSIGPQGSTAYLSDIWSLLVQNGVSIVLSGHDHDYQRWAPLDANGQLNSNGTTSFVVGTAGHGIQGFVTTDSRMVVGYDTSPGAIGLLKLALSSNKADFQFINYQGSVLDSGSIPCNKSSSSDTNPPTAPANLTGTVDNTPEVTLNWTASTDNVGVAGYTIYRNSAALASVPATALSYIDTSVQPGNTYTYKVNAYDAAGNRSSFSNSVTLAVPNTSGTIVVSVNADSYVSSTYPTKNYGSATTLRVDGSPIIQSYLRFNVQGTTGYTITQALLHIYSNSSSSSGVLANQVLDNSWGEYTITYQNAPGLGAQIASSGPVSSGTWVDMDVTPYVTGDGTYSIGLQTNGSSAMSFPSRESGTNMPELLITLAQAAASPTPSPTPTSTPQMPTPTPTATNVLPSPTPTDTTVPFTPTPTDTPIPLSPTPTDTATAVAPTATNTPSPTITPTPTPTSSTTGVFNPVEDAYVNSANPSANYGSSTALRVDGSPIVNSYLKFDIQNWSGSVSAATLWIYANSSSSSFIQGYAVNDSTWSETTINYNNAPPLGMQLGASSTPVTGGTWISIDVTAFVTGNGLISLAIATPGGTQISLASRENTTYPPRLEIQ